MKTGNRRRRKLNRLAKARALRARCERWQQMEAATRKWDQENRHYSFPQPDTWKAA
jgi:hypothetical protein